MPASLADNDDLLLEILLLLPPLPSSLLRASLVCRRWRRLLSDPQFRRRFRAHHGTPPLLGVVAGAGLPAFFPTLSPPDRIPPARFSPPQQPGECWRPLGCRHGLALFLDLSKQELIVWDPVTGHQRRVAFPELGMNPSKDVYNGAVLVGADGNGAGHLHGDDRLSSFRLVLVCNSNLYMRAWACLYESKSGRWGNVCSVAAQSTIFCLPGVLVGSALCWVLRWCGSGILEFDTERQSLAVSQIPEGVGDINVLDIQVVRTEERELGLAVLAMQCIHLWGRTATPDGAFEWVRQKIFQVGKLPSPRLSVDELGCKLKKWLSDILGYDEDNNVILVATTIGTFTIQLDTLQSTQLPSDHLTTKCYPYASFYTAVGGGDGRAERSKDTQEDDCSVRSG